MRGWYSTLVKIEFVQSMHLSLRSAFCEYTDPLPRRTRHSAGS